MLSELSYEEYLAWCKSRVPDTSRAPDGPASFAPTIPVPASTDGCPVTVRSVYNDCVVVTPRPSRSR